MYKRYFVIGLSILLVGVIVVVLASNPTATSGAFDVENLTLGEITELDVQTDRSAVFPAPNGEHFAYLEGDSMCIYEGDQEQTCIDLSPVGNYDLEKIRWSPDSRYLTMSENFYDLFIDPDIWVINAIEGTLSNLTDDEETQVSRSDDAQNRIDVYPTWTNDGQIIFLRYNGISDPVPPPEIHRIAPDSSGSAVIGSLEMGDEPWAIYALDVWQDKLVYVYLMQGETTKNGIWISDLDGKNARQINQSSREVPINAVEVSPDGKYALYRSEVPQTRVRYNAEASWMRVVEIETGEEILLDPEQFVAAAGWSPHGAALIYTTYDDPESGSVFLTDLPGNAGKLLHEGRFNVATGWLRQFLTWGTNNVIMFSRTQERDIVLMALE